MTPECKKPNYFWKSSEDDSIAAFQVLNPPLSTLVIPSIWAATQQK